MADLTGSLSTSANLITTVTVSISNNELVINPNSDKFIEPITQPAGTAVTIKYGTNRVDKTTQQFLFTTAGDGSSVSFSKDFKSGNKENDIIDVNSVNTYLITLFYWDEKTKYVFVSKGAARDTTAPSATFTPSDGGTLSSVSDNITIDFDEAIRATDGKELINDGSTAASHQKNVGDLITLKETDSSGADVAFTATINSALNKITINPNSDLTGGNDYYVELADHEDYSGNEVGNTQSITFTVSTASYTVLVEDDFDDNFFDTNKWTKDETAGTVDEQNKRIEVNLSAASNHGETGIRKNTNVTSITNDVLTIISFLDVSTQSDGLGGAGFGLFVDVNNYIRTFIGGASSYGANVVIQAKTSGSNVVLKESSSGIGAYCKITYNFSTKETKFFFWDDGLSTPAWVQIGTNYTADIGTDVSPRTWWNNDSQDTATLYIDDLSVTDGDVPTKTA